MGGQSVYRRSEYKRQRRVQGDVSAERKTVEVDPEKFPYGQTPGGRILDIARLPDGLGSRVRRGCACSTCHVMVKERAGIVHEATDAELDELDEAPVLREVALGCQTVRMGRRTRGGDSE